MKVQDVRAKFATKGKRFGGVFLLQPSDALDFIEAPQRAGLHLLGVEGFRLPGNKIQPFQEHSNDMADTNATQEQFYQETKKFIRDRKDNDLWFEVVVVDPE